MVFRATIVNGRIEAPEAAELPEGMKLEVRPLKRVQKSGGKKQQVVKRAVGLARKKSSAKRRRARSKNLWDAIGHLVKPLPGDRADGSLNVDHYLYGAPKR